MLDTKPTQQWKLQKDITKEAIKNMKSQLIKIIYIL